MHHLNPSQPDLDVLGGKQELLDLLPQGVLLIDLNYRVQYINPCCAAWLGTSKMLAEAQPLQSIVSATCYTHTRTAAEIALRGTTISRQYSLRTAGQPERMLHLQYQAVPASAYGNHETGILITAEDISEIAHLRINLIKAEQELERFAYIASHNLKTPIRNISIYTGLLGRKLPDAVREETSEFFTEINQNCHRTYELIESILETSMLRNHEVAFTVVDCLPLVRELSNEMFSKYPGHRIDIQIGKLPTVVADIVLLRLIFMHLLDNGIKFNQQAEKQIRIQALSTPKHYEFIISDNGIGIDEAYHDQLFVLFQKLQPDSHYSGSGTGLAITKQLVELHGGDIWVENTDGLTSFHFTLPIHWEEG